MRILKVRLAAMHKNDKDRMIPTDYFTGNVDIAKSPLVYLLDKETCEIVDKALGLLDPRTETIIREYYGFNGASVCYREIAKKLGISTGRVQQIISRVARHFRYPSPDKQILKDYVGKELLALRGRGGMPARHYVPEWKRPIVAHVNKYRYRAYFDFDLRAFLQGKMSTKEMMAYFSTKQETDY